MFLGLDVLGDSFAINSLPSARTFEKLTLYGQSIIDEVHLHSGEMSDVDILALNTVEPFGGSSLLLGHFENSLAVGDYTSLDTPIVSYDIEKRIVGESQYTLVKNILQGSSENSFSDYSSKNKILYEYAIFPIDIDSVSGDSSTANVTLDFFGHFLVSPDNTQFYKFDMELTTDAFTVVEDIKIFEGFSEFPVVSFGNRKYKTGRIETIPYSWNENDLVIDINILNEVEAFINDKKEKYYKNTLGELYRVITKNFSYQYYDKIPSQAYRISFDMVQIGKV